MSAVVDAGTLDASVRRSFDRMWGELAPVGRDTHTGGYRRYAWTREDAELATWFAEQAGRRGLDVVADRAGNQWAWWGSPDDVRVDGRRGGVAIGSHLDSVPDGGAFDGPLGVVSALAVVDALQAARRTPGIPLAVVRFRDEEGARFGIACAGSRLVTAALEPARALALRDADGVTMAEALRTSGHDPGQVGPDPEAMARLIGFVELHVEQGRALADPGRYDQALAAVAVGSDIWPHGRWRVDLPGTANHAGTTRLEDRDDAMLALAGLVVAARESAGRQGCVATVGKVRVEPGGVNAIASHVTAWLDGRGSDERAVRRLVDEVRNAVGVHGGTLTEESWTPATTFDPDLTTRLQDLLGPATPLLGTGAGHDAGILATAGIPSAMLFVRNPTGVSHSPLEHAETADCHLGVAALAAVVADLTGVRP
ncbi:MAG: allantoate amidohydrolase [Actinomycetota bacterium]|nr:allantoate amidohydrolase [Actinomycetota bacterium]